MTTTTRASFGPSGVVRRGARNPASVPQNEKPTQAKVGTNSTSSAICIGVGSAPKAASICEKPTTARTAVPPKAISLASQTRRLFMRRAGPACGWRAKSCTGIVSGATGGTTGATAGASERPAVVMSWSMVMPSSASARSR